MDILITGASRGIGLELCRQLVRRGHRVVGTVRKPEDILAVRELGAGVELLDVRNDDEVLALAERRADKPLDVLINNAGVGSWTRFEETSTRELQEVFDINAIGPLRVSRAFLPALIRSKGRLFHITSRMGSIGDHPSGGAYAYRMSKAALNMFSANLAADLRGAGVTSVVLHPGWVRTDMGGAGATLGVEESAGALADVIERTGFESTGKFLSWDGSEIPW